MIKNGAMRTFVMGCSTGIVSSVIVWAATTFFIEPMRFSISYGFPPVAGTYTALYPDHPEWKPEAVVIHQLGFNISGTFVSPEDKEAYELDGDVTSSRVISYQFRPKNKRLNDYGTGLIKLNKNGDGGAGYVLFLSEEAESPTYVKIIVKRQVDE